MPRPPSTRSASGGGERYFWAFVVALALFSMGAVEKLFLPHGLESQGWAFAILCR